MQQLFNIKEEQLNEYHLVAIILWRAKLWVWGEQAKR